jgi:hypothetical protein
MNRRHLRTAGGCSIAVRATEVINALTVHEVLIGVIGIRGIHEELHGCTPPPGAKDAAENGSHAIKIVTHPVSGGDVLIVLNAEVAPYTLVRSSHRAAYRTNRVSGSRGMEARVRHVTPWTRWAANSAAISQHGRVHICTVTRFCRVR